ncbi:MAG TPA: phytoene/squalene synthase family protein [Prolixibacteraceae bacterium]|nr:phytoene/squalene synthase family protein [Prolixibacteraceae bacterium]
MAQQKTTSKSCEMDLYSEMSFQTSRLVTQTYSTSFSIAVRFLPEEMRRAIFSLYGFVRLSDEIVDTFGSIDQKNTLEDFERQLDRAMKDGISINPVLHSFALTVSKYAIPADLIDSFLKSMKADLEKQVYASDDELREYIYGSAEVVGLMCLKVFVNGDKPLYEALEKPAIKLGSAFQKVNFLRDLRSDVELLNRTYFPSFDIHSFNEAVKNELIDSIRADFDDAYQGLVRLPGKSKLAVYIAYSYYRQLLKKLKYTPASRLMNQRIRVSDPAKMVLLFNAWLRYSLRLIN